MFLKYIIQLHFLSMYDMLHLKRTPPKEGEGSPKIVTSVEE